MLRNNEERPRCSLAKMSIDFENLKERVENPGLFEQVMEFDEKREDYFPELAKYIPINFKEYKEIYVYCDSDPIGYYLNQKRIKYHALEDGLNCLKNYDAARYDNRGRFGLKAFMSEKLNLIFIQNGYGKYCLDMEVNDISAIEYPCHKYIEVPHQQLIEGLDEEAKDLILDAFIRNKAELERKLEECGEETDKILILTEPLCDMETRERIFRDIIKMFEKEGKIFIKLHPRDELDYEEIFSQYPQFDGTVPMEMLNFFPNLQFKKVVGVLTEISGIRFSEESIRLGADFMDKYEEPSIHRQNEQIY